MYSITVQLKDGTISVYKVKTLPDYIDKDLYLLIPEVKYNGIMNKWIFAADIEKIWIYSISNKSVEFKYPYYETHLTEQLRHFINVRVNDYRQAFELSRKEKDLWQYN